MKTLCQLLVLLTVVASLTGCIDADQGKMQGNKAAGDVTGSNNK